MMVVHAQLRQMTSIIIFCQKTNRLSGHIVARIDKTLVGRAWHALMMEQVIGGISVRDRRRTPDDTPVFAMTQSVC